MLLSAKCELLSHETVRNETIAGGTLKLITRQKVEELHGINPYYRAPKPQNGKVVRSRNDNFSVKWIESMVTDIIRYSWTPQIPPELSEDNGDVKDILVPGDIREQLANMLLKATS